MGENPGIIPGFSTRNTYVGRNLVGCNQGASYNVFSAFPVSGCGNSQRYVYKKDLEFIYYEITRIIDNLKDLQKMMEFTAWMQGNLPILGIESAWLFLYSQCTSGIHTYTLLTGYDMQEPGGIELKDKIPENMIFDDILSKRPDRFYCILPLLFKEEKFGLLAMEVNIFTSLVYDTKNRQQGIGVGLSIVKKIIDELGAVITVEKRKGGGTCFTIVFTDESQAGEREALQKFQATTPVSYPVQNNIKERNITADKRSLFIVDDNIQLLKFIQSAFCESYNVFLARNTAEALVKLKVIPCPDLIVSDIMMDGEDGFGLLSALSENEGYNDIPFIFLTVLGGERAKLKGFDLGAIDYIEKPFSIAALRSKIESIIELRGRQEKKDLERIRNRINGLLTGINKNTEDSALSRFKCLCEKYGIFDREREIIRLLASGLLNKEIALCMNISQRAVEYHLTKIYKKCGVSNKYDLLDKIQD